MIDRPGTQSAAIPLPAALFGLLLGAAAILTWLTGDIGFWGDDWWIFSRPFWNGYLKGLWVYTLDSSRPVEGLYWLSVYETFGFNRSAFLFLSLGLSAAACALFTACVRKAWPTRPAAVILAAGLVFVLPTWASLTYEIHTDNSRLALTLFWLSVLLMQQWAARPDRFMWLFGWAAAYLLSCLTYETATFLVFTAPAFALPVYLHGKRSVSLKRFGVTAWAAVLGVFLMYVGVRLVVFHGGAVSQRSFIPDPTTVWEYIRVFGLYLIEPATYLRGAVLFVLDPSASQTIAARLISDVGIASSFVWAGLLVGGIVLLATRLRQTAQSSPQWTDSPFFMSALGLGIFLLGILPYILAGYGASVGFTSQSRVYSSAGFGFALMLVGLVAAAPTGFLRKLLVFLMGLYLFTAAVFFAGLRVDWRVAAETRRTFCDDIKRQVPGVKQGAVFLFLDLQSYMHASPLSASAPRAVIFQGVDGLNDYIKMIYRDRSLQAFFLYSEDTSHSKERTAKVDETGITPRGALDPVPLDRLIIFRKSGNRLILLDRISKTADTSAIDWNGTQAIETNTNLVLREGSALAPPCSFFHSDVRPKR